MEKSVFEQMGGKYEQQGDYRLPCLALPADEYGGEVEHLGRSKLNTFVAEG